VWVVDTPANTTIAHRLTSERRPTSHLDGITTFWVEQNFDAETELIQKLTAIDLHHGPLSANPPYTRMQVFGAALSPAVREALVDYCFTEFRETPDGSEAASETGWEVKPGRG
jgi:hypothetical protein